MASKNTVFPLGTRKSKLAMTQTEEIRGFLQKLHPHLSFPIISISSQGDLNQTTPLHQFSSNVAKGLWTEELEVLLSTRQCRLVVNSLKDLPTTLPEGFCISAVGQRADPRDVVVMAAHCPHASLAELPAGSVVGTSSIRRSAQIKRAYPGLEFADVRGNIGTRLAKLDDPDRKYSCLILAAAGLERLGLLDRANQYLEGPVMYQAPGQGALAIEILTEDTEVAELLKSIDHYETRLCTWAERGMMRYLQGGCSVPIGCESKYENGTLTLTGAVISVDGQTAIYATSTSTPKNDNDASLLGEKVAQMMIDQGAKQVLADIALTRGLDLEGDVDKKTSVDQAGLETLAR